MSPGPRLAIARATATTVTAVTRVGLEGTNYYPKMLRHQKNSSSVNTSSLNDEEVVSSSPNNSNLFIISVL